ncbi:MAG: 30S ribosomal protein S21 [Euryarchaeota archaeon]|nr:30S ribosomal protein S21 [Euryarchaeota archaeon]|tara:strand:- start:1055 stop:1297 length:243 start_codon:yes stop_codon:yes gene_type:complete
MISVKIGHSDNNQGKVIKAMQKLKQIVSREGILNEVKKRRHYVKPSMQKRLKREEAERQRIKDIRKDIKQAERLEQQMWG